MKILFSTLGALIILSIAISSVSGQRPATQSLDARIRAEVTPFKGKVYLFAKNLDTGESYAYNGDERVKTASTIFVAVLSLTTIIRFTQSRRVRRRPS